MMEDKFASIQDLKDLSAEIRHSLAKLESELTFRMGVMFAVWVALIVVIQKLR